MTTHGESRTRIYGIWKGMRSRCLRTKHRNYASYGGRGISICDEWKNSYEKFRDWAFASGFSDSLTLDRIDVNGNYEPSNCRWATVSQQNANRRKHSVATSRFKGVNWKTSKGRWAANIRVNGRLVHLGYFPDESDAGRAYDAAATEVYGEFARLNFPESTPCP